MNITMLICISARFRKVHVISASPFGVRIRIEEAVAVGEPVMITHVELEPIAGRISWVQESIARIEFTAPLSPSDFAAWFDRLAC